MTIRHLRPLRIAAFVLAAAAATAGAQTGTSCFRDYRQVSPERQDVPLTAAWGAGYPGELGARLLRQELAGRPELLAGGRPAACIALSGGGQRSAAFAIGVLSGLQTLAPDFLANTAYLSAVSGGGYALGWLETQALYRKRDLARLLDPQGSYLAYLAQKSPEGPSPSNLRRRYHLSAADVIVFPTTPIFRGWSLASFFSVPPAAWGMYADAVRNQYVHDPEDGRSPPLAELAERWRASRMPYPIWGAAAYPLPARGAGEAPSEQPTSLCGSIRSRSVEISLDKAGNSVAGYTRLDRYSQLFTPLRIEVPLVISGAAFEVPGETPRWLGMYVSSVVDDFPDLRLAADGERPAVPLWLTDGGKVENLGAWPLLLRGCSSVLMVDAEEDPYLRYEAYLRLKDNLRESTGALLEVPGVESYLAKWDNCTGYRPQAERWAPLAGPSRSACRFAADAVASPQFFAGSVQSASHEELARVAYLKLALPKDLATRAPAPERAAIARAVEEDRTFAAADGCSGLRCRFPQDSTFNQAMDTLHWDAYVALGRALVLQTGARLPNDATWLKALIDTLGSGG